MTEEIQYLDDELNEICSEIRRGIDELNGKKLSADKKSEKVVHLTDRINRAKQVYHNFKVELRELTRDDLKEYEQKGKDHNNTITNLVKELQAAKQSSEKTELMDGAKPKEAGFDSGNASAQEIINEGSRIQDESKSALSRAMKTALSAEQIGAESAAQLKAQTEQMKSIHSNVTQIESNLKRADVLMRQFMKRMATDKIVLCFIFLLVVGIITIIAWKATHKGSAAAATPST